MRKVNLFILGTQKAGTTSLYEYIKQHDNIYFSDVKEVTYFVEKKSYTKGDDYFHSFFSHIKNEKIIASCYVHMLPCKKCPLRVKKYNPDMKFIIMLRDPVKRAYSAYKYAIKNGWENKKNRFEDTLNLEKERILKEEYDLMYFENGLYYKHIKNWQNYFPKKNFLLINDTELRNNRIEVLEKIFQFLQIENQSDKIDISKEYNKAGTLRFPLLQSFFLAKESKIKKSIGSLLNTNKKIFIKSKIIAPFINKINQVDKKYEPISKKTQNILEKYFQKDKEHLKELQ